MSSEMNDNARDSASITGLVRGSDSLAFGQIYDALLELSDENTGIDTGYGIAGMDLWVTIGGAEYIINARPSARQRKKESH